MNFTIAAATLISILSAGSPRAAQQQATVVLPDEISWKPLSPKQLVGGPVVHVLSGNLAKGPAVFLLKLPGETEVPRQVATSAYTAVVVSGTWMHASDRDPAVPIPPGAYWAQPAKRPHAYRCPAGPDCIAVVHARGPFALTAAPRPGMANTKESPPKRR